jgi:RHS repeat-associated protein
LARASGLPTTYRFTGQRQEVSLGGADGLYYYGARWYDSALGRWTQPDTVLPQNQGTQAWDRMAYVNNNPVVYKDPSGHDVFCTLTLDDQCVKWSDNLPRNGGIGKIGSSRGSNVEQDFNPLPDPDKIPDPGKVGASYPLVPSKTRDAYEKIRKALLLMCGWECIGTDGKINDDVLLAIIIMGEFGTLKNHPSMPGIDRVYSTDEFNTAYYEALEGLSNEYDYYLGHGSNSTVETQLSWLLIIESFRADNAVDNIKNGKYKQYMADVGLVTRPGGFTQGTPDTWIWGNILDANPANKTYH